MKLLLYQLNLSVVVEFYVGYTDYVANINDDATIETIEKTNFAGIKLRVNIFKFYNFYNNQKSNSYIYNVTDLNNTYLSIFDSSF